MTEEDLMPCPFCGGKAFFSYDKGIQCYAVYCSICDAMIPLYMTPEEAAKHWNGRADDGRNRTDA